jgi:hypothetical protein
METSRAVGKLFSAFSEVFSKPPAFPGGGGRVRAGIVQTVLFQYLTNNEADRKTEDPSPTDIVFKCVELRKTSDVDIDGSTSFFHRTYGN